MLSKRFIDTQLWQKEWFMNLSPKNKCAVMYIFCQCDNVGVWCPNKKLAEIVVGQKIDWDRLPALCNGNIKLLKNGKWFLIDFCSFQYGELNENCIPHKSYIKLLEKHGLLNSEEMFVDEGYIEGIDTPKDKEKDKEKEKEKEEYAPGVKMPREEYQDLCERFGKKKIDGIIERISDYQLSKGKKKYDDYPATIKNWMRKDAGVDSVKELEIPKIPKCPKCGKSWENEIRNNKSHCMNSSCNEPIPKNRSP